MYGISGNNFIGANSRMYYLPYTQEYMFLDDDELDAQMSWRRGSGEAAQTLFQSPANGQGFPKAFHTYRSKQYETNYPPLPVRVIVDSDDDYPYAPRTP
jgi:hypothetical protein